MAELALGILPGDERARMLAHLEGCERCQVEAERLTATADTLLHLAPEIEPPLGLEVRLFERLDVSVPNSESKAARKRIGGSLVRLSHRGRVLVAAAAATVAIALGFGGGWVANAGAPVAANSYSALRDQRHRNADIGYPGYRKRGDSWRITRLDAHDGPGRVPERTRHL